jgi:phosphate starvation-inducible PhoH-like protein
MSFHDNGLAMELFGSHHSNLAEVERALNLDIHARGNQITISGSPDDVKTAQNVLTRLYGQLERGRSVLREDVEAELRMAVQGGPAAGGDDHTIRTRKRHINPRSPGQKAYLEAIDRCELVFGIGPAGTGKTYLAVAKAVERLVRGEVDRIILSRPAVEAGEQLGFLPGDMREKVDPYLRPLYDALYDMLPGEQVARRLENGEIEIAPLAFMRGRTLANAFVILDEAQNTTAVQMKMFLTRLGENSRMVITGDLSQVDLPKGTRSGLRDSVEVLSGLDHIAFNYFTAQDVVRHPLVAKIVTAYEKVEKRRRSGERYKKDESSASARHDRDDDE